MTSERRDFRNLRIWQLAQEFATEVCLLADALPRTRSADVIARQFIRSATSVAANIAEGHGRYSLAAYRHHLSIARGSATESRGWVDLLVRLKHISSEKGSNLDAKCARIIAILTLRINDLDRRQSSLQARDERYVYNANADDVPMFGTSDVPDDVPMLASAVAPDDVRMFGSSDEGDDFDADEDADPPAEDPS